MAVTSPPTADKDSRITGMKTWPPSTNTSTSWRKARHRSAKSSISLCRRVSGQLM
uniref:Uncharacterized protein n=1 Tax=uncultured marine virus TaxID=186617 RepID=A0A0F7L4X2_9VIRU|nr:hypothetical protein [uncultured marine virus]